MTQTKEQEEAMDKVYREMFGEPPTEEEMALFHKLLKERDKEKKD